MKPSEINARLQEIAAAAKPLRDQLEPLDEEAEALKKQKAAIVNATGVKIRQIRDSGKMPRAAFAAWRESVMAMPADDRVTAIDAKISEYQL
jgi:hypothetical protein